EATYEVSSPLNTIHVTSPSSLGSQSHTYVDNGTYTVTVKVTDKDGAFDSKTFTVTVANVAPTVAAAGNQIANEGTSTSFALGSRSEERRAGKERMTAAGGGV